MDMLTGKILIIGIGSEHRRDDETGIEVAREMGKFNLPDVVVMTHTKDSQPHVDTWLDARAVILIDAVCSDHLPGTLHRFDLRTEDVPLDFFTYSSQANRVVSAFKIARLRTTAIPPVIMYGIDGIDFGIGGGLSAAVAHSIPDVLICILQDILTIRQPKKGVNGASLPSMA